MTRNLRPILFVLFIVAILVGVVYYFTLKNQSVPVLSPTDVNPELVDPSVRKSGKHRIADFDLTDQQGKSISLESVRGKIFVTDFFFTTCPSICPVMTGQMGRVAEEFKSNDDIKFLSFSVLPDTDTPEVLRAYADKNSVNYDQWKMITGDKKKIYELARKSFFTLKKAEAGQGDGGESDFIHTNNFVLVDRQQRIRGYYDGTSLSDVDKLISDINILINK